MEGITLENTPEKNPEMIEKYDASDIQVLEGLDAVRKRPGMYIGSTGPQGLHHLVYEIVDNAIDEVLAGNCTKILVDLLPGDIVRVKDNGRGIPVGIQPKLGIPAVTVVFTVLHAGGKFGGGGYKVSGGLHGVGASVVNALSRWTTVDVFHDFKHYQARFESVTDPATGKITAGHTVQPLKQLGNTRQRGSLIRFLPDDRVFETIHFNHDTVCRRLRELAYLNKGLAITFTDERIPEKPAQPAEADADAAELTVIRRRRETECFAYINRGELWYSLLTEEQKAELANWYLSWLDAPETQTIPAPPVWLDKL